MSVAADIALAGLGLAALLCLVRIAIGPSLPERIVASDTLVMVVVAALAVDIARSGSSVNITMLVVVVLVGFVGTSFLARYLEARGPEDG